MKETKTLGVLVDEKITLTHGPDGIPGWLLKENAHLLTGPISDFLNCSYRKGHLPTSWKEAAASSKAAVASSNTKMQTNSGHQ